MWNIFLISLSVSLETSACVPKMPADAQVTNVRSVEKVSLQGLIHEHFGPECGKHFYSIEVNPKKSLQLDFSAFKTLPLFVDISRVKNADVDGSILEAPAFQLASGITSVQVVNTITCYKLGDRHLDEILSDSAPTASFTVLVGSSEFHF